MAYDEWTVKEKKLDYLKVAMTLVHTTLDVTRFIQECSVHLLTVLVLTTKRAPEQESTHRNHLPDTS